jgi:NitT/TauT family transport system ATP-binding protein
MTTGIGVTASKPKRPYFVEMDDVGLVYGQRSPTVAVERLDLRIETGEFVAVVGPSGCGKSSLMKLTTGLVPPTRGGIIVNGREVSGPVKVVGVAFQNPTMLPWRTTISNVMLPLEIVQPHRGRIRREREAYRDEAMELLKIVGLDGFANKYPWQLSGGMQQRASLCRALIHRPSLLMLDEPFGALDAFTREELWDVLQNIWLTRKFTTILVTHDLREAVYLADRVIVMSARPGRIVATHQIDLPRPRSLDMSFEPRFVQQVLQLRQQIAKESGKTAATPASVVEGIEP